MLFNENEQEDLNQVLAAADGFIQGMEVGSCYVQTTKIQAALRGMREDFPAKGGLDQASAFKKCANFLCYIVADGPLLRPFSSEIVGDDLVKIANHQNAMLGLHIVIDALENATIHRRDGDVMLGKRIQLSTHSYIDIIQAVSSVSPQGHFHLVSVLLEQMCYRFNPSASYETVI